ncbi:MAG: DNA-binding protein [Deltaproteobacteria bacterium]|nr:DNA-binding protein [Deltaproteobacteria bacterium]
MLGLSACPSDEPQTEAVIDIADARELPSDGEASVEGVVTVAPGVFNSAIGDQGFAIQDESGGIYVSVPELLDFDLGDRVRVSGRLAQVAQFTTLLADPATIEVTDADESIAPIELATGEVGEATEGQLVRVTGTLTQAVGDDSPYGFKVFIDDGSGEIQVFVHIVDGAPVVDLEGLEVGVMIAATGLSAQYESTYEVTPRIAADVEILP